MTFLITNYNLQLLFLVEADHYKKLILDGNERNIMPDENTFFDKYYNTCLIVKLTIIQ